MVFKNSEKIEKAVKTYRLQLDILLNGYAVPELSTIVHSSKARTEGKRVVEKLKDTLPRQMFKVWFPCILIHICLQLIDFASCGHRHSGLVMG
ncbi:Translation factor GUF1, mitochondrial [Portunus trituberculatus]|uniref:Translation factor GUF1, mitochondrial n=1 Tax=Portunus trituberculatus TaxID=210409 RepID=A0A5B7IEI5_PORTR|nr:Translation factor GUF1, mitochondrial [Portunus trituberculatus]